MIVSVLLLIQFCGILAYAAWDQHLKASEAREALLAATAMVCPYEGSDVEEVRADVEEMWRRPSSFIDQDDPELRPW